MKETKNVPQVRFSGFDDEWENKEFSELFERRMERNNGQFGYDRWISVAKMYFQKPDKVTSNNIDTRTYVMRKSDIAFEGHSNKDYKLGRFVENDIGDGVISELFPIYKHIASYDLNYWKYAIQIERIMFPKLTKCIEISYTSSNKLDEYFFLKEHVLVPSCSEQKKIGTFISHVDSLIQAKTKKLESLKAVKKSLLQKCFPKEGEKVPEMRFAGFSGDWEEKKLGEIANIYDGTHQTPKYQSTGVKFLSVENIKNLETEKYISTADFVKDFKLYPQKGDILMTRIGDIGTTNIYLSTEPIAFYVSLALLKPTNIDSLFLNYVIQSPFVQNELSLHTLHTAIPKKINKNEISLVKLLVPSSKSEQQKIGQFFSKYDSFISAQQKEIDKLKDIKKSLLQKMFV